MAMQQATWVDCPGVVNDGKAGHMMRDYCSSCGPFWERLPVCPHCRKKLLKLGKTKCKGCGTFVMVVREERG